MFGSMKDDSPNTCFTNERGKGATKLKRKVSALIDSRFHHLSLYNIKPLFGPQKPCCMRYTDFRAPKLLHNKK